MLGVALPEEMPVNETIDLERRLADELGMEVGRVVVNGVLPERFTAAEARRLRARRRRSGTRPRRPRCTRRWSSTGARPGQREQLERLRARGARAGHDAAVPVRARARAARELELLSDRLEEAL